MEWKRLQVKKTSPTARTSDVELLALAYSEPRGLVTCRPAAFRAPRLRKLLMGKLCFRGVACLSLALLAASAHAAVHYVDVNNATPSPPYTNWSSAALTIQDAVDVSV